MNCELREVESKIYSLLASNSSGLFSVEDLESLKALRGRKAKLMAHEITTWMLKSRSKLAEMGDANTKYFHSIASARRNHNSIWALKYEENVWVEEEDELKDLGIKHFSDMFKDDLKTNIVDQLKVIQLFPSFLS